MSQFTKLAIIDCTLKLAEKKPVNKITVRDIVDACGITRNTFYYYFHDIFDVLDSVISEKITEMQGNSSDNVDQVIFDFLEFISQHKKVLKNLYRAVGYDPLYQYAMTKLHTILKDYFTQTAGKIHVEIPEKDMSIMLTFYEEALFGVMMRWLRNEKGSGTAELSDTIGRIRSLFEGQLRYMLDHSQR